MPRCPVCTGVRPKDSSVCIPCVLVYQLAAGDLVATPEREVRFHDKRRWRFDLAFREHKVAIEVDGGLYSGGRHVRGSGYQGDLDKMNSGVALGWRILRFSRADVESGKAATLVRTVLQGEEAG